MATRGNCCEGWLTLLLSAPSRLGVVGSDLWARARAAHLSLVPPRRENEATATKDQPAAVWTQQHAGGPRALSHHSLSGPRESMARPGFRSFFGSAPKTA